MTQENAFGLFAATSSSEQGQSVLVDVGIHAYVTTRLLSPMYQSTEALRRGVQFLANVTEGTCAP